MLENFFTFDAKVNSVNIFIVLRSYLSLKLIRQFRKSGSSGSVMFLPKLIQVDLQ